MSNTTAGEVAYQKDHASGILGPMLTGVTHLFLVLGWLQY